MKQIIAYIKDHACEAKEVDGKLMVLDVYTKDGRTFAEWIQLPLNIQAVKEWLGY